MPKANVAHLRFGISQSQGLLVFSLQQSYYLGFRVDRVCLWPQILRHRQPLAGRRVPVQVSSHLSPVSQEALKWRCREALQEGIRSLRAPEGFLKSPVQEKKQSGVTHQGFMLAIFAP